MKKTLLSIRTILSWNTLIVIILAIGATYLSIYFEWKVDFPLTIIGVAVVFPIVFSIGGAYSRREKALGEYGTIKGLGRAMFFASRDWIRDTGEAAEKSQADFKQIFLDLFVKIREFFQTEDLKIQEQKEEELYTLFTKLSKIIEGLRDRGLSGSEVSRVNSHYSKMITAFETLKHIFQYRTPRTLRAYSKVFIYLIPIIYAPYFALLAEGQPLGVAFVMPVIFALIFTCLDNIQEHLENPFDQLGEDDIKINAEKFVKTLDL